MSQKTIVVIANLDTRGREFEFVKGLIQERGHRAVLLDFSMKDPPPYSGDITCDEVARRGGAAGIDEIRELCLDQRKKATDIMVMGAAAIVGDMCKSGEVNGVLGIGGATAAGVATRVMHRLPFGLPKIVASSMVANGAYASDYFGTRDVILQHTVVDVVEMNPLLRKQVVNAVGAICGMVEMGEGHELKIDKPLIAVTSFGFSDGCTQLAVRSLRERGFEPVSCHAQGKGDRAMDELIREGLFAGVLDIVTRGIGEQLFGGNCAAGDDRILAASEAGIPQIVSTSGLDMLSYGNRKDAADWYKGRKIAPIDALRVEVRTSPQELVAIARVVAERLNVAKAPARILIPIRGWSSLSAEGRELHAPEADAAFVAELKKLLKPEVVIKELDVALNSEEFALLAVDEFDEIYRTHNC